MIFTKFAYTVKKVWIHYISVYHDKKTLYVVGIHFTSFGEQVLWKCWPMPSAYNVYKVFQLLEANINVLPFTRATKFLYISSTLTWKTFSSIKNNLENNK